jgi:hypothetical protein
MYMNPSKIAVAADSVAHPTMTLDRLASYLLPTSIVYLAIPHLIFYLGWLQWPWALVATVIICVGLASATRVALRSVPENAAGVEIASSDRLSRTTDAIREVAEIDQTQDDNDRPFVFTRQHVLMIGAVCLFWLAISGVGGFVRQDYDWEKHNAILNSLIVKPWPTVYEVYQEKIPLVYYIAYYLPGALVGKAGGWFWANQALFVWSYVGLYIALTWFCILVRRVSYSVLAIFVLFSGLDLIGKAFAPHGGLANAGVSNWRHIDSWAGIFQYSSNSTQLFWVPHQALAGWVLAGLCLYCLVLVRRRDLILLPLGLSTFWSPFITLGIIPYLVIDFLIDLAPLARRIRQMISLPNIVGVIAVGITAFYFAAKAFEGSPIIVIDMFSGFNLSHYNGPIYGALLYLAFFCLLEFGLYAIILYRSGAVQDERWRWMLDITVLTLCVLPWFRLGVYNDLVMRASIPALFVLAVLVTRAVHDASLEKQTRRALVVLLLIGAYTPGTEIARHFYRMAIYPPPLLDETQAPGDILEYFRTQAFFFSQYSGSLESPFFQVAAKPPSAKSDSRTGVDEVGNDVGNEGVDDHDYVLYGKQIYLLRDQVELAAEVTAGSTTIMPLELHFYGPLIRRAYKPTLQLANDRITLWRADEWPNLPPPKDPFAMTIWTDTVTITVPITATPGLYEVAVGFYDPNTSEYLPAHSVPEGLPLEELVPVGSIEVVRRD